MGRTNPINVIGRRGCRGDRVDLAHRGTRGASPVVLVPANGIGLLAVSGGSWPTAVAFAGAAAEDRARSNQIEESRHVCFLRGGRRCTLL